MRFIILVYGYFFLGIAAGFVLLNINEGDTRTHLVLTASVAIHLPENTNDVNYDSLHNLLYTASRKIGHKLSLDTVVYFADDRDMAEVEVDVFVMDNWQPSKPISGKINIMYVPSDCDETCYLIREGFTSLLPHSDWRYYRKGYLETIVIRFDNIYEESTLIHELGHFFGLGHQYGSCRNYMSNSDCASSFDADQLDTINMLATGERKYLFDE